MNPTVIIGDARLYHADCRDVLRSLPDNSVDSCVCDPPYALVSIVKRFANSPRSEATENTENPYGRTGRGFMGQKWDNGETAFATEFWAEVLRVLKPGGHVVAFSGTRTYHRMAVAIEDAGFEIRDRIRFEQSFDTKYGPLLDSMNDEQRGALLELLNDYCDGGSELAWEYGSGFPKSHNQPGGYGTALKPAYEPICLARKPLISTVAANLALHGTGAINIDGCRVEGEFVSGWSKSGSKESENGSMSGKNYARPAKPDSSSGRWPANIVHDGSDEVVAAFPDSKSGVETAARGTGGIWSGVSNAPCGPQYGDSGSAARFFYAAKASRADREQGLDGFTKGVTSDGRAVAADNAYQRGATERANTHPTVKPTSLMQWLCRLVTPPGGVVLDPFMGSGSTGKAALLEGFRFIGCEREDEYMPIAEARIRWALDEMAPKPAADNDNSPQLSLFGAAPAQAGAA
ncbi:MAG: site-specific DNA-methyltransferase [Ferrovibrio sp.]|uniref:DNA-methyltransferase n=1 Tax=Ferrovibrio sp. TaxID=1917215 RepID=UPI0026146A7A|nr:site-specific DNA-methyltransferase [Ferrovibrio sp.]MCW0235259.1 site-specific DNA-methyltransferase [Ferrovibrio sp.]